MNQRLAQLVVTGARRVARALERTRQVAQRDVLLLLVALDRVGDPGVLGRELLGRTKEVEPVGVEPGAHLGLDRAELLAVGVGREHGELRLRVPERHLLALERHARGEQPVLELVLALGELRRHEPRLARLAKPVEELAGVAAARAPRPRAARRAARG